MSYADIDILSVVVLQAVNHMSKSGHVIGNKRIQNKTTVETMPNNIFRIDLNQNAELRVIAILVMAAQRRSGCAKPRVGAL